MLCFHFVTLLSLQHLKNTHFWNPSNSTVNNFHRTSSPKTNLQNIFVITETGNGSTTIKANSMPESEPQKYYFSLTQFDWDRVESD